MKTLAAIFVAFSCVPISGQVIEVAALTVKNPVPESVLVKPALRKVIHRSGRNWTDPDVGPWTIETLTLHLLGELESTQHRGKVPYEQLHGRTLQELIAIHANLHEGYRWDGQPYQSQPLCPT